MGDQHFMVDKRIIKRICEYANTSKSDTVLEIGAGTANLTQEIANRAKFVYAIEKNPGLILILNEKLKNFDNFEVIDGDALTIEFPGFDKVLSNLPYRISKKITVKLLKHDFKVGILVYQREFAEKLVAKPKTSDYKFISALVQSVSAVRILEYVPKSAFQPRPRVRSAMIEIKPKQRAEDEYIEFLRTLFNYRNKFIKNIMEDVPGKFSNKRPFELSAEELLDLYLIVK